jgi:CO/xanthine dehydrogenase Mo-binding subunit
VRARETLQAAVRASSYGRPKAPYVGRGVAIGDRGTGGGEGTVEVTLNPDGTMVLGTPIFDQGSGTYTLLAQVVAEELGVPVEKLDINVWDTDVVPSDSGLAGSHGTRINSIAGHAAAQEAKSELFRLAVRYLGWPADRLVLRGNEVRRTDLEEAIPWPELLRRSGETISVRRHVDETARSHITSFAAQVAEVSVDPETGEIRLLSFTTAHDAGQVMNPAAYRGQIYGGLMQGLGYALMEELRLEDGRVTTLSFGDYKMPTIRDVPALTTVILESDQGEGPYKIRGIGEAPCTPVAPAIANAIADAIGVRIRQLPLTAEKVYEAMKGRSE